MSHQQHGPVGQPRSPAAPASEHVGAYRLLTRIGEGGMGVVHLAQAPDGSRVALKVLRPHIVGDDESRERLAREVASLHRVRSRRVAEVLDADPWGPTPFVATRYVPGLSLHEHVRDAGPITGGDLTYFAICLAEAVVAVHQVGVLHRDIKPSNVLLEGRAPVLIDFGLARLAEDSRLTQTGWLLGTPGYLAPEILYGDDATTASDVHSWAATVVFAATGRPPFGAGPPMAVMDRVRRGEHDLSAVPADLRPLLEKCLAPEPQDRPETASVLAALRQAPPAPVRPGADPWVPEQLTMPFALTVREPQLAGGVAPTADQTTEPPTPASAADPPTLAADPATAPTLVAGVPVVSPATRAAPHTAPLPVLRPQAAPVMSPGASPPPALPPPRAGATAARMTAALLFLGLGTTLTLGLAWAPYLGVGLLAVAVQVLRTWSWTAEATRDRQRVRGSRRWYDGAVGVVSTPWFFLVAAGGTVLLVGWSLLVAVLVGVVCVVAGAPLVPSLVLMGASLVLASWHGPGSHRLRTPVERAVSALSGHPWRGWLAAALVVAAAALCAYGLGAGVVWNPAPGAPWRAGTLLGDVLGWL